MTQKRPGLMARNATVQAAMVAATQTEVAPPPPTPRLVKAEVGLTVRLDKAMHEALMDLSHQLSKEQSQRVSIHSLLLDGIDLVLKKHRST